MPRGVAAELEMAEEQPTMRAWQGEHTEWDDEIWTYDRLEELKAQGQTVVEWEGG